MTFVTRAAFFADAIRHTPCLPLNLSAVCWCLRQKSLRPEVLRGSVLGTPTASKAEARARTIERAVVLLTTSVHFGIECGLCGHCIPLVEIISGPRDLEWFVPGVPPLEVHCGNCGASRTYRQWHVIVFEAPTIEDLETYPAFRDF